MPNNLNINFNSPGDDHDKQLRQVAQALQLLKTWSANQGTSQLVDFKEPQQSLIEKTASTTYIDLRNFTQNVVINNPTCEINFSISIQGNGYISIVNNNNTLDEIYFSNTGFSPVTFHKKYSLSNGNNKIKLQWKAQNGTITKSNSSTQQGQNYLQIYSFS